MESHTLRSSGWLFLLSRLLRLRHDVRSTSFLFMAEQDSITGIYHAYLYIHKLMDILMVSTSWLLQIIRLQRFPYRILCGYLISLRAIPRSGIAGNSMFNFLKNCQTALRSVFYGPQKYVSVSVPPHPHPTLATVHLSDYGHSSGHKVASLCGFQFVCH